MTPVTTFFGKKVALFGLGGSGLATVKALQAGGADVIAWDDSPDSVARAARQGVPVADLCAVDWTGLSAFILSPGVPLTHPEPHWTVPLARAAGVEIIGDVELFCRERAAHCPDAPFIAITGTNGKSTTTALIAHILREAGRDVQMGGNIGTAILSLEPPSEQRIHVVELSTFQIDLTPSLHASIGVLLNLTPDHLDRHGTMEAYAAIKERLIQTSDLAVIGVDDAFCRAIAGRREVPKIRIHVGRPGLDDVPADLLVRDGEIIDPLRAPLANLDGIGSLRGPHNWQNAAVATAVVLGFGIEGNALTDALASFPGLPHRMEQIAQRGRVLFVNDSKATNADSTEKALTAFRDIHWIVGGKAKEGGIASLSPLFDRVAHAYLIGASSEDFAKQLRGVVPFTLCETLEVATAKAAEAAAASDAIEPVVLLSPACASYDQFKNFEVRGDRFRDLVKRLG